MLLACFEIFRDTAIHSFHGIMLEFLPNSQDGYKYDHENAVRVWIVNPLYMVWTSSHQWFKQSKGMGQFGNGAMNEFAATTICESLSWGQN